MDFTSRLPIAELKKTVESTIEEMGKEISGISLEKLKEKKHSWAGIRKYRGKFKLPLTVRLEFSLREKPLTKKVSPVETLYPVIPYPLVVHLAKEELLAEKVRALLTRAKGRDVFDVWYLLSKEVKLQKDYINQKMRWYEKIYSLEKLTRIIKGLKEKELENDLNKFLPKNYRPFVKELKTNLLKKLQSS